jgi:hypothetical protein
MEFNFNTETFFKCDEDGIAVFDSSLINNNNRNILTVLDRMGVASSNVNCY